MRSPRGSILLVTNLDTRGIEFLRMRDLVLDQGLDALVMDVSMEREPPSPGDIPCEEVARAGGLSIEAVRVAYRSERKVAADCMMRGGGEIAARLYREGRIDGVLGAGGATGTLIATTIMKRLPFGVPKVMASSVGSHASYVGRYVGTKDIMMLNTVVDVMGMNPLLERQLTNAVGAICGAVRLRLGADEGGAGAGGSGTDATGAPVVGITSFGFAERSVEAVIESLRRRGFEPVPFHAQGKGDRAMDEIVRDGLLHGIVDIVTRGIGEEMLGGNCAAGADRILAASQCALPQVLAPSGLDMLSVGGQPGWRERFDGRAFAVIDELRVEVRTTPEECREMARVVAERLNAAPAPFLFLLPTEGWSSLDREGGALWDPAADAAFAAGLRADLRDPGRVRDVPGNLYSEEFGLACADAFLEVWEEDRRRRDATRADRDGGPRPD